MCPMHVQWVVTLRVVSQVMELQMGTCTLPTNPSQGENYESNIRNPCKPVPSNPCSHSSQPEPPTVAGTPNVTKSKNSLVGSGISEKRGTSSMSDHVDKTFAGTSRSPALVEKFVGRKVHSGSTKREYMLHQKSLHLEKHYLTYGSKGSSRAGKLSGLILDKKLKSVSDITYVNIKSASLKISRAIEVHQDNGSHNLSTCPGPSSPIAFNSQSVNSISALSKTSIPSTFPPVSVPAMLPLANTLPVLSAADTELSLSLPIKSNSTQVPAA